MKITCIYPWHESLHLHCIATDRLVRWHHSLKRPRRHGLNAKLNWCQMFCSQDEAKATMAAQTQAIFCGLWSRCLGGTFCCPVCQIQLCLPPLTGGHRHRVCEQKCLAGELPGGRMRWDSLASDEFGDCTSGDMTCWFGMIWAFFVELQEVMISGSMSGWNSRWEIQRLNRIELVLEV